MDKIFGEMKLDPASQNDDGWLISNVLHPFANGTGVIQIYDTIADKPLDLYKVPQAKTFSTDWCAQALSSAAGAVVPFVIAGHLTGSAMQSVGSRFAAESITARVLNNHSLAQIAGAGLYTFAQKPAEGHTRLAAAAGTMAGFAFFSAGNAAMGKMMPEFANGTAAAIANGTGRFAVGAAAGLGSYESANVVSQMQGVKHESNWDERLQAMAHGGFVNVALPVVQEKVSQAFEAASKSTAAKSSSTVETQALKEQDTATRLASAGADIVSRTDAFEKWMAERIRVLPEDLDKKHAEMSSDAFKFMRGTYYRWAEKYPELLPDHMKAPKVNSVGDLHTENFGTWTDRRGRLIWGVNDFDESYPLPYTNDLVRLVTSANLMKQNGQLKLGLNDVAAEVLAGYKEGLQAGGKPFVLSEDPKLEALASQQQPKAGKFWKKLDEQISGSPVQIQTEAMTALRSILSDAQVHDLKIGHRQAGMGSLGRERFAAMGELNGQNVAAEVKAMLPSSNYFASGKPGERSHYIETMGQAVREMDPNVKVDNNWVARGLGPDRFKIDLTELTRSKDEATVLHAMGYEAANIHLGTKGAASAILKDLAARDPNWLVDAARTMTKSTQEDFEAFKNR